MGNKEDLERRKNILEEHLKKLETELENLTYLVAWTKSHIKVHEICILAHSVKEEEKK